MGYEIVAFKLIKQRFGVDGVIHRQNLFAGLLCAKIPRVTNEQKTKNLLGLCYNGANRSFRVFSPP